MGEREELVERIKEVKEHNKRIAEFSKMVGRYEFEGALNILSGMSKILLISLKGEGHGKKT